MHLRFGNAWGQFQIQKLCTLHQLRSSVGIQQGKRTHHDLRIGHRSHWHSTRILGKSQPMVQPVQAVQPYILDCHVLGLDKLQALQATLGKRG
jgi:hypothetical protein